MVGTAHSFNDIADTDGFHVSLVNFKDYSIHKGEHSKRHQGIVTFGAGFTYSELLKVLKAENVAIANLPSLPHINVVGSIVTGTHGSGHKNKAMSDSVYHISIIDPKGEQKSMLVDMDFRFKKYLHSFGSIAIITEMSFFIEPEYAVLKCIYEDVAWDDILGDAHKQQVFMDSHEYISMFTNYSDRKMNSVWLGGRVDMDFYNQNKGKSYDELCPASQFGGTLVEQSHPVPGYDKSPCVKSGLGMWHEKIYHFEPDKPPSSGGDEI